MRLWWQAKRKSHKQRYVLAFAQFAWYRGGDGFSNSNAKTVLFSEAPTCSESMPGPLYGITLPSYTASRHWQAAAFCWRLYCRWNRALANALSLPNKNHKCTGSGQEHVAALANGCWQDASAKEKSKNPKGGGCGFKPLKKPLGWKSRTGVWWTERHHTCTARQTQFFVLSTTASHKFVGEHAVIKERTWGG